MKKRKYNCPAELAVSLIGGKWKAIILYNLRKGEKRFGELKRLCPGITSTTLTQQLKELEESGILHRKVLEAASPAVSYGLTLKGESLKPILYSLIRWGLAHQKDYVLGEFGMRA